MADTPLVDALDTAVLQLFAAEPRIGVLEASRRLGVARGTVQARLDRLVSAGVIRGWARSSTRPRWAGRSRRSSACRSASTAGMTRSVDIWPVSPRCSRCTRSPGRVTCGAG